MKKYEYSIVKMGHEMVANELDVFGQSGWELCLLIVTGHIHKYHFKREII